MKILIYEGDPTGGTTVKEAELSDEIIDECKMRPALVRFGRKLAEQFSNTITASSHSPILGVELRAIDFTFVLGAPAKCVECGGTVDKHWHRDHKFKAPPGPKRLRTR